MVTLDELSAQFEMLTRLSDRDTHRSLAFGWGSRLLARVFGGSLDRALLGGADPAASRRLAARVASLNASSTRASLADSLELLVRAAQQAPRRTRVSPRPGVIVNAELMFEIADRLRGGRPLYAIGIAMLNELLSDGIGPVFGDRDGSELEGRLTAIQAALGGARAGGRAQTSGAPDVENSFAPPSNPYKRQDGDVNG